MASSPSPAVFKLPGAQPLLAVANLPSAASFAVEFLAPLASDERCIDLLTAIAAHHEQLGVGCRMSAAELLARAFNRATR